MSRCSQGECAERATHVVVINGQGYELCAEHAADAAGPRSIAGEERTQRLNQQIAALSPSEQRVFFDLFDGLGAKNGPLGVQMERFFFMRYLAQTRRMEGQ